MKSVVRIVTFGFALVVSSISSPVFADHRSENDGVIRVHIPVHVRGPERLPLARMINRHRRVNLDNYVLRAVVVHGSHGHTRLTVGRYSSPIVHLNHRKVRIAAPAQYGDHWRLHLGPNTRITAVTAILEPRQRYSSRGYAQPGFDLGWLWRNSSYYDGYYREPHHGNYPEYGQVYDNHEYRDDDQRRHLDSHRSSRAYKHRQLHEARHHEDG